MQKHKYNLQRKAKLRRSRRRPKQGRLSKQSLSITGMFGLVALACVFIGGIVLANWSMHSAPSPSATALAVNERLPSTTMPHPIAEKVHDDAVKKVAELEATHYFELCGNVRVTCVVDGDTFWFEGQKIRVADIDTPEISQPKCQNEKTLGNKATVRFMELLNEGPFELNVVGDRDQDQYGRKLRVVTRDGTSLGDLLVSEGLARTWTGRREPWCGDF